MTSSPTIGTRGRQSYRQHEYDVYEISTSSLNLRGETLD